MIHLVVNDTQKLRRALHGVRTPSVVQTTTSILVVDMPGPIVHKRGPFFAASWISGYAVLKKVALTAPGEIVVRSFHFNVSEELLLQDAHRRL